MRLREVNRIALRPDGDETVGRAAQVERGGGRKGLSKDKVEGQTMAIAETEGYPQLVHLWFESPVLVEPPQPPHLQTAGLQAISRGEAEASQKPAQKVLQ